MNKIIKISILSCFIVFNGFAQYGSSIFPDARYGGMAGTLNALARGSYSLGINPADMYMTDFRGDLLFVLPVPQVSINAGSDFLSLNQVNYYFGGVDGQPRYLSEEDKNKLQDIFDKGGDISYSAGVRILAFSFSLPKKAGLLGFAVNDIAAGRMHLPQSAIEIPLWGNLINKLYSFNDANFKTWWIRNYAASYSREIQGLKTKYFDRLFAGLTLKLVHGYFYAGTDQVNSFINTGEDRSITVQANYLAYTSFSENLPVDYSFDATPAKSSNFQIFPKPAGIGLGFDIGLSAMYKRDWNFSLAFTDIGYIKWKSRAARFVAKGDIVFDDMFSREQRDSLSRLISGKGEYIGSFSTGLPAVLRTGASYVMRDQDDWIPGNLTLAMDYNQGLNDLPGNSTTPRISLGGEWQPLQWLFVRTGFSIGGFEGFSWAAGLGLAYGIMELNFASSTIGSLFTPNDAKRISFAFNSRWRFY